MSKREAYIMDRMDMQSLDSLASTLSRRQDEQDKKPSFLINHEGKFKHVWDWIVLLLVIFTAIQVPYYAAFYPNHSTIILEISSKNLQAIMVATLLVDCMFLLDIFINFRTTYIRSTEKLEKDPKKIAIHYLKSWFVIDLLAAIPFEWMLYHQRTDTTLIGLLKSARLLRLFRVARRLDRYSEYGITVLLLLMCLFTLFAHWLACLWNYLSNQELGDTNSWVHQMDQILHPPNESTASCNCSNTNYTVSNNTSISQKRTIMMTPGERYVASLYFIMSSLTSVGFGNIAATTKPEQIFSVIVMLIGALMYACIFGNMVAIVQRLYSKGAVYHTNINSIQEFMKFHKLPEDLQKSINSYIRRDWIDAQNMQADIALQGFPYCIQADVKYELYKRVFYNVKPFSEATVSCMRALAMKFKTILLQADHVLLRQGEEIKNFYIVGKGAMEVILGNEIEVVLMKNSTFGIDIENIDCKTKSKANVRAERLVQIHYICKEDLSEVMQLYPIFAETFKKTCTHDIDLNDVNEEGYRKAPRKQELPHVGVVARKALGLTIASHFNKRKQYSLRQMEAMSDNFLYNPEGSTENKKFASRISVSNDEISTTYYENNCVYKNSPKSIIKPNTRLTIRKSIDGSDIRSSTSSVRFEEEHEKKNGKKIDHLTIQRIVKLEEKVEEMNNIISCRFNLILQTLNEINSKCGKSSDINGDDCIPNQTVHNLDILNENSFRGDKLPASSPDHDDSFKENNNGNTNNTDEEREPILKK